MNIHLCKQVQAWLLQDGPESTTPPPTLSEHVATCPHCLGALATLATTFWHVPVPQHEIMCSDCQRDLAAYMDLEREDPGTAVRTYPEVWWHLWTCVDCSEQYELTRALLEAEAADDLAPLPIPVAPIPAAPTPSLIDHIRIARARIHQLLNPNLSLGVAWGNDDEPITLADLESAGYRVSISAQQQPDASWNMLVQLDPPVAGQAQVTIGSSVLSAQFTDAGQAVIENISDSQLVALEGPDIFVDILRA